MSVTAYRTLCARSAAEAAPVAAAVDIAAVAAGTAVPRAAAVAAEVATADNSTTVLTQSLLSNIIKKRNI